MPKRIQLRRTKGWRKPEGAVVCTRPGRYGNPYRPEDYADDYPDADPAERLRMCLSDFRGLAEGRWARFGDAPPYPSPQEIRDELAGRDLGCSCALDQPCHVDILLEVANS